MNTERIEPPKPAPVIRVEMTELEARAVYSELLKGNYSGSALLLTRALADVLCGEGRR